MEREGLKLGHCTPMRTIALGFALIILLGGALLCLPAANRNGAWLPFLNALFTSASAACVTGLVVYDTWSQFTLFGQLVLLLLIQIGGLGFMTVAMVVPLLMGRRIGLRERDLLVEAVGAPQLGGVIRLVRRTLLLTLLAEGLGAALLSVRFVPLLGVARGLWTSLFHAVSAFCNAGFDLMGRFAPFSSLTLFFNDPLVLLTTAGLIIAGGVGFVVWNDLIESRFQPKALKLHTRVVLLGTGVLLLSGTVFFLFSEVQGQLSSMTWGQRLLSAFFQSVTPRTAGFNALDMGGLTQAGKLFTVLLMFVGAAPGGTGGGVKLTTLAVIGALTLASLRGREEAALARFRVSPQTQRRACAGAALYLFLAVSGVTTLCLEGQPLDGALFECFSAIGTVGLSTGVTGTLWPLSKVVVILLMYAGRVGSLTVFLAVTSAGKGAALKDPVGNIIVG